MAQVQKSVKSIYGLQGTLDSLQTQINDMGSVFNYVGSLSGGVDIASAYDLTALPASGKNPGDFYKITNGGYFNDGVKTLFVNKNDGVIWNLNNEIEILGGGAGGYVWIPKTTGDNGYILNDNDAVIMDSTNGPTNLNLPSQPFEGASVFVFDGSNNARVNPITVFRNNNPINGAFFDVILDKNGAWAEFIFSGGTWVVRQSILGADTILDLNAVGTGKATDLNADLVDGFHASVAGTVNTLVARDTLANVSANSFISSENALSVAPAANYFFDSGDGFIRKKSLANTVTEIISGNGAEIIAELNSVGGGLSTGLNSDLFDGKDSSLYQQRGLAVVNVSSSDVNGGIQLTPAVFDNAAIDIIGTLTQDVTVVIPEYLDNSTLRPFILDNKTTGNYNVFVKHFNQLPSTPPVKIKQNTRQMIYHENLVQTDSAGKHYGEIENLSVSSIDGWTPDQFNKNHVNPPLSYFPIASGATLVDEITNNSWSAVGDPLLNQVNSDVGPFAHAEHQWTVTGGTPAGGGTTTGGFETNTIEVDSSKTYRIISFVRKNTQVQNTTQGLTYVGVRAFNHNVETDLINHNSSHVGPRLNGNLGPSFNKPQDFSSVDIVVDDWVMVVGYIHGSGTPQETDILLNPPHGGVYANGKVKPVAQAHDYVFPNVTTHLKLYNVVEGCTDNTVTTHFCRPIVEVVDGSEMPLGAYFAQNIQSRAANTHIVWEIDSATFAEPAPGVGKQYYATESEFDNASFDLETTSTIGINNDVTIVCPNGKPNVFVVDNQNAINSPYKVRFRTAPTPLYNRVATGGTTTTLVDTSQQWSNNFTFEPLLHDYVLSITNGAGTGIRANITAIDNVTSTVTFTSVIDPATGSPFVPDTTTEYRIEEELDPVGVLIPNGHRVIMYSNGTHCEAMTSESIGHGVFLLDSDPNLVSGDKSDVTYELTMSEFNNVTYDFEPSPTWVFGTDIAQNDVHLVIPDGRPKIFVIDNQNSRRLLSTATGGTTGTIVDTSQSWTVDQWAGYKVEITTGLNAGERRTIVSNTANTLVLAGAALPQAPNGDEYIIQFHITVRNFSQPPGGAVTIPNASRFMLYTTGAHVEGLTAVNFNSSYGVMSFNGRTGNVFPNNGDYSASMVGAIAQAGVSTLSGNILTTNPGPIIQLNGDGTTSGYIQYDNIGFGTPQINAKSIGTKMVLSNTFSQTSGDFGIGISDLNNAGISTGAAQQMWFSVSDATIDYGFEWFAGNTRLAGLDGVGTLDLKGGLDLNNRLLVSLNTNAPYITFSDGGVNTSNISYNHTSLNITMDTGLELTGELIATTKSFLIDHPTKEGMKLRYGSLEGPENGVYFRGRLKGKNTITLPDYWTGLVDEDTITVNLTPIGKHQKLFVEDISGNSVEVGNENFFGDINCFFTVFAERKDVSSLVVEYAD